MCRCDEYNIHNFEEYFCNEIEKVYNDSKKKYYGGTKEEMKASYRDIEKKIMTLEKELRNHPFNRLIDLEHSNMTCLRYREKFQRLANTKHLYFFQGSNGDLLSCPAKPIPLSEQELKELKETDTPTCGWKSSKKGRKYVIYCVWPVGYRLPISFPDYLPDYIPGNWRESLIEPKEPREGGWD